jgi:hypothetical protein
MNRKYRVVVVGISKRGMHHALAFQANGRFEVAGDGPCVGSYGHMWTHWTDFQGIRLRYLHSRTYSKRRVVSCTAAAQLLRP